MNIGLADLSTELVNLAANSLDFAETQTLKKTIQASVFSRNPPYLNAAELDQIVAWKLDSQYPRSKALRE